MDEKDITNKNNTYNNSNLNYFSLEKDKTCINLDNVIEEHKILADTYKCPICSNLIYNPETCSTCFEIAGEHCINKWLENNTSCPISKCENFIKFPKKNPLISKALDKIRLHCEYEGCKAITSLDSYYNHLNTCEYKTYFCKGEKCHFQGKLSEIEQHVNYKCNKLTRKCSTCNKTLKVSEFAEHAKECKETYITCEYCHCKIKKEDFAEHSYNKKDCFKIFEMIIREDEKRLNNLVIEKLINEKNEEKTLKINKALQEEIIKNENIEKLLKEKNEEIEKLKKFRESTNGSRANSDERPECKVKRSPTVKSKFNVDNNIFLSSNQLPSNQVGGSQRRKLGQMTRLGSSTPKKKVTIENVSLRKPSMDEIDLLNVSPGGETRKKDTKKTFKISEGQEIDLNISFRKSDKNLPTINNSNTEFIDDLILPTSEGYKATIANQNKAFQLCMVETDGSEELADYDMETAVLIPNSKEAHYLIANSLEKLGNYNEAISYFTKALELDLKYIDALSGLGHTFRKIGEYTESIDKFQQILLINPNNIEALYNLAFVKNVAGNYSQAIESVKKVIQLNKNHKEAYYLLAMIKYNQDYIEESNEFLVKALQIDPNYKDARNALAENYESMNLIEKALAEYGKLAESDPTNFDSYFKMGVLEVKLNNIKKSIDHFKKVIEINPTIEEAYINLGNLLEKTKKTHDAISIYEKVKKLNELNTDAYYNLGVVYGKLGSTEKSIENLEKLLSFDPDNFKAPGLLGFAYEKIGNYAKAIHFFKKAIDTGVGLTRELYFRLGISYDKEKLKTEASESFQKALEIDPKFKEVYYYLGIALENDNNVTRAMESFKQALKIDPKYKEVYFCIGKAMDKKGKIKEASENFTKALELDSNYKDVYLYIGHSLESQGKYHEALEIFKKVLKIDPYNSEAEKIIELLHKKILK